MSSARDVYKTEQETISSIACLMDNLGPQYGLSGPRLQPGGLLRQQIWQHPHCWSSPEDSRPRCSVEGLKKTLQIISDHLALPVTDHNYTEPTTYATVYRYQELDQHGTVRNKSAIMSIQDTPRKMVAGARRSKLFRSRTRVFPMTD